MQHEAILRKKDTLFLIIDIQERLLPAVAESDKVLRTASILAQAAEILDIPLIISEQYPKGLGHTVPQISDGMPENTQIIEKTTFSCLQSKALNKAIKSSMASQIVICGIESHICVTQTALDLAATGSQIHLLTDGISSRNPLNKEYTITRLARAGIIISNLESALFELLIEAKGDEFKAISKLIK